MFYKSVYFACNSVSNVDSHPSFSINSRVYVDFMIWDAGCCLDFTTVMLCTWWRTEMYKFLAHARFKIEILETTNEGVGFFCVFFVLFLWGALGFFYGLSSEVQKLLHKICWSLINSKFLGTNFYGPIKVTYIKKKWHSSEAHDSEN